MGGILSTVGPAEGGQDVSSRAPVWGASGPDFGQRHRTRSFKSCPRVGGIPVNLWFRYPVHLFQVVPPCGGHPAWIETETDPSDSFKSCPRVGGIVISHMMADTTYMFQVVPPCGGHHRL